MTTLRELLTVTERPFPGFVFRAVPTGSLTTADRQLLSEVFDACFRHANHAHLKKSLELLRYVSVALRDEKPAGFTLGDVRVMDLPRLGEQTVMIAGLACVAPGLQRRGRAVCRGRVRRGGLRPGDVRLQRGWNADRLPDHRSRGRAAGMGSLPARRPRTWRLPPGHRLDAPCSRGVGLNA